jgi:hypothetical protein
MTAQKPVDCLQSQSQIRAVGPPMRKAAATAGSLLTAMAATTPNTAPRRHLRESSPWRQEPGPMPQSMRRLGIQVVRGRYGPRSLPRRSGRPYQ